VRARRTSPSVVDLQLRLVSSFLLHHSNGMADKNRRKEVEALLAVVQQSGHAVPLQELTEYLRLVSNAGITSTQSVPVHLR